MFSDIIFITILPIKFSS